jgi:hypothetical protein
VSDNYGHGFYGFKARIDAISAALGGESHVRLAVSESFRKSLTEIMIARPRVATDPSWRMFDWTTATDKEFDDAGARNERYWAREPEGEVIATAPWGGRELQLRQDNVSLAGDGYWLPVARIMESSGYSYKTRQNEPKWSPYLTDEGCYAALS